MVLGIADIGVMTLIIGVLVSPLYGLFISLNRSYSSSYSKINREIGELTMKVEQNTKGIEKLTNSIDKLIEKIK